MAAGLARLEVRFHVDANGMLSIHAKEMTTGVEQKVTVQPMCGLDDETVERMLADALDSGKDDLNRRRVAENRVDASRILHATRKALESDADLVDEGERDAIERACVELEAAAPGEQVSRIQAAIDALDDATKNLRGPPDEPRHGARDRGQARRGDREDRGACGASSTRTVPAPGRWADGDGPLLRLRRGNGRPRHLAPGGRGRRPHSRRQRVRRRVRLLHLPRVRDPGRSAPERRK
jgi:hypothetical protein